jgi:methionine-S-sulfoxide reductase
MNKEKAIFAAGCFWGVQDYFDQIPGVLKTSVGYSGGFIEEPTYEEVCTDKTGHAEAILIEFSPEQVSYETLLKHFFMLHDPTQYMRQGPDVGSQYRSAVFFLNEKQREAAEKYIDEIRPNFDQEIVTEVTPATEFYEAEDYHQKFTERTGRGACHVAYKPID